MRTKADVLRPLQVYGFASWSPVLIEPKPGSRFWFDAFSTADKFTQSA